ncbi:MAG TPA: polyprenol monophosphomannose synthase [Actinomycetota bacterium]|nr:polyprenol monophosphomannose synthase [Actinomycetota bacterium]
MNVTTDRMRALVIVPTYNERATIAEVARRLFEAAGESVELMIVDDGSPDGTAEVVKQLAAGLPNRIHLIERPTKLGLCSAYLTAFAWALERGYDAVVEMDADLSHDPRDVPRLLAALEEADLAIGSRYVPGGGTRNWGRFRHLLSRSANVYARALLGFAVADSTAGFRAYRTGWLATQDLSTITSEGYAFQIEMTRRVHLSGGRIDEVPITFVERTEGRSKMSRRIVFEALWAVARWGVTDRWTKKSS